MLAIPAWVAGATTIALFVVLGILVYPAWLRTSRGRWAVAATTVLLTLLFYAFQAGAAGSAVTRAVFAAAWALAPLGAGLIVWRLQNRR
jgi:hypothetical protein